MTKRILIVLALLSLMMPVLAQDLSDDEADYLDEILEAFDATVSSDTYRMEGEQTIEQEIESVAMEITQIIVQQAEGEFINHDDGQDAYVILVQEINQNMSGAELEIGLTQEMLILDGEVYVQFSNIVPAMLESLYPHEWVSFEEAADEYQGLAVLNVDQLLQMMDAQSLVAPFVAFVELATEIEHLDDESIDGQDMTVYRMRIDADALFDDDYMETSMELFNFASMGIEAGELEIEIEAGASIEYSFYIGQDDGLLHRSEAELEISMSMDGTGMGMPGEVTIDQEATSSYDFFDFGEEIELPDPEN